MSDTIHGMCHNDRGSVLIALIITVVVMAALGGAMVSLTSTSLSGLVGGNSSARAYFLAESGFRYAENLYLAAGGSDAGDDAFEAMHGDQFTLLNGDGYFNLQVYPYFYKVNADPSGGSTLSVRVPGGFPADLVLSNGRLRIGSKKEHIYAYTAAAQTGQNVVFNMAQTMSYFPVDTDVLPVATSDSTTQTVINGGDMILQAGTGDAFPLRNGTVAVDGNVYAYRENDLANHLLNGISDPDDPGMVSFVVAANTDIILQKFVKLESTGLFGGASAASAASRQVVYHIPLAMDTEERITFVETFADLSSWHGSTYGSHEIQTIDGDTALRVTGTSSVSGAPMASLIGLDWTRTDLNLDIAHASGNPYFLSYDAQVKVGFDSTPYPDHGFDPVPIPTYYAAGLSFRLDNDNNAYGLSFLRGSNGTPPTPDNIDNDIVPVDRRSLIVLWQQTDSGTNQKWLAYRDLNLFFDDDVEQGENGWTTPWPGSTPYGCPSGRGLWHVSTRRPYPSSSSHSWYYGNETTGDYNVGQNCGALVSPATSLCSAVNATLTFWSWYETENDPAYVNTHDLKYVEVSSDGGPWNLLYQLMSPGNAMNTWERISIDLSAYAGHSIRIRFRFDSRDALFNSYEGWYIDDVRIEGDSAFSLNESTLLVRVREASSITFSSGGPVAIEIGDTVVGGTSGVQGKVADVPLVASGDWASSSAVGTLMVRNTSGSFLSGEDLLVVGSATTSRVDGFRQRDNFIRAYYGDTGGCGTPNSDNMDEEKHAVTRGDFFWPPEESADWQADNDYFRLVQWQKINSGVELVASVNEPSTVVRSDTLTSPTASPLQQPELGLHTFGKGSENIYFDDFAVQTTLLPGSNSGFSRAIQQ